MMRAVVFFYIIILSIPLLAQEVAISPELNLRNYYAYEILGEVDDRIMVFRDKGFTKELDVFNNDMEYTQSTELTFEKKKVDVFHVMGHDSVVHMLYGFFEKDTMEFRLRVYDRTVTIVDTVSLIKVPRKNVRKRINYFTSEDKSKTLLTTRDGEQNLLMFLYDAHQRKIVWTNKILFQDTGNQRGNNFLVTNHGEMIMILDSDASDSEDVLELLICSPKANQQNIVSLVFPDNLRNNFVMEYDNRNKHFLLIGSYAEEEKQELEGYFIFKSKLDNFGNNESFKYIKFPPALYEELLLGKKRKEKALRDLYIQDVVLRNDGGVIIVSEIQREYSRRNPYNSFNRAQLDAYGYRGWIDFYRDDIVVTNIDSHGKMVWNKVLYKKQFSQDDDAVFSSFFIMKVPSRLRFIYNDEIKTNSTVSEYLLDPIGQIARNSILSTQYQDLKLRFQESLQISANSILVPSEKNYNLSLVKLTY